MDDTRNEFVEAQQLDIEAETPVEEGPRRTPWDPRKIRVSTKPWSLRQNSWTTSPMAASTSAPDFQRPSVWTNEKRSRLIESILLGIPLPALYFSADRENGMQVVDGVQRLAAIRDFANNALKLGISSTSPSSTPALSSKDLGPSSVASARRRSSST